MHSLQPNVAVSKKAALNASASERRIDCQFSNRFRGEL